MGEVIRATGEGTYNRRSRITSRFWTTLVSSWSGVRDSMRLSR